VCASAAATGIARPRRAHRRRDGLGRRQNGALLQRAAAEFDVFLTVDQNVRYQQNLSALPIPVIVLIAASNDIDVLRLLMPKVRELLSNIQAGRLYEVQ
jgi:hypothetical protein